MYQIQSHMRNPIHAKVAEGLWVGNKSSCIDVQFLADEDITAIINLSGTADPPVEDVDYFDFMLPSQELLDIEFPKTLSKLEAIANDIKMLRDNGRSVLIHCSDGKNKCVLAAGYYLITQCEKKAADVIEQLELLYLTAEQKREEMDFRSKLSHIPENPEEGVAIAVSVDAERRKATRNEIKCLTIASFRKILRVVGSISGYNIKKLN